MTPGVSMLEQMMSFNVGMRMQGYLRLALEILHNVQKSIIDIRLVVELDLNLIQIGESILGRYY